MDRSGGSGGRSFWHFSSHLDRLASRYIQASELIREQSEGICIRGVFECIDQPEAKTKTNNQFNQVVFVIFSVC